MTVRVLLFGAEADAAGRDAVAVSLPPGSTCERLKDVLAREVPELKPLLSAARLAVNAEFAPPGATIHPGDEVALIGLVSGG
jgi:molybdopterin converting factor small subunit